eukprot:364235-Chlamydomonas_euryale.AAC.9
MSLDANMSLDALTPRISSPQLQQYFDDVDATERTAAKLASSRAAKRARGPQDEEESAGNRAGPLAEPYKVRVSRGEGGARAMVAADGRLLTRNQVCIKGRWGGGGSSRGGWQPHGAACTAGRGVHV